MANRTPIESGDVGVFVTCEMGREKKCLNEAIDLFSQVRLFALLDISAASLTTDIGH
jgi:hypothetical protein